MDIQNIDIFLSGQKGLIIHQIWFNLSFNSKKLFKKFEKYQTSWIVKNCNWRHMLWNEKTALEFMKYKFPEYVDMYLSYKHKIQRIDVLRYFLLYEYGGIYVDMDLECICPIDVFRKEFNKDIYFVETNNKAFGVKVSNLLMFSVPKHIFWKVLFIELNNAQHTPWFYSKHLQIMYTTGPAFLNRVYNKYVYKFKLNTFPSEKFNPLCLGMDYININKNECYTLHYGEGSWESADSKFLIFLYCNYKIILFIIWVLLITKINYKKY